MNQVFKNLSVDEEITTHIPRHLVPLEVVAAASVIAREIAGKDEPDRHTYLAAVPRYISSLPDSVEAAVAIVKIDAARSLGIPQLATDAQKLADAQAKLAEAQAEVESAEAVQGKRLQAIHRHERELEEAQRDLESWQIDFEAEIEEAEKSILEYWGRTSVVGRLNDLAHIPILKKLQPIALKAINSRIKEAKGELAKLHAPV